MPQFNILDQPATQIALAAQSLTFLMRDATFVKAGVTMFQDGSFQRGEAVSISRPKDSGDAEDYDPYTNTGATESQPGNVIVRLVLDRLFTKGFPVYSSDSSATRYVEEYGLSNANSVRRSLDNYFYDRCFLDMSTIAATGVVQYSKHPPLAVIWAETATGTLLPQTRALLTRGNALFKSNNVPAQGRFAILSPDSVEDLFANAPTDEGRVGSLAGGVGLLSDGLQEGEFINRHGFMVGNGNAISGQDQNLDISAGNPTVAISAVADDTTVFFQEDYADPTPLGAVQITVGAALQPTVAVGQIVRIGAAGATATAYGRILRIDPGLTNIWVVPYDSRGRKIVATEITAGTDLISVPRIRYLNTLHHAEHLVYATRRLTPPSDGSGARLAEAVDAKAGVVLQVLKGDYKVDQFKESCRTSVLAGCVPTDHRKAALMLCN